MVSTWKFGVLLDVRRKQDGILFKCRPFLIGRSAEGLFFRDFPFLYLNQSVSKAG
jgi:hypothetical protein